MGSVFYIGSAASNSPYLVLDIQINPNGTNPLNSIQLNKSSDEPQERWSLYYYGTDQTPGSNWPLYFEIVSDLGGAGALTAGSNGSIELSSTLPSAPQFPEAPPTDPPSLTKLWSVTPFPGPVNLGGFYLQNVSTNQVVDVANDSITSLAPVHQYPQNTKTNQNWILQPATQSYIKKNDPNFPVYAPSLYVSGQPDPQGGDLVNVNGSDFPAGEEVLVIIGSVPGQGGNTTVTVGPDGAFSYSFQQMFPVSGTPAEAQDTFASVAAIGSNNRLLAIAQASWIYFIAQN